MRALAAAVLRHPSALPPLSGALVQTALGLFLVLKSGSRAERAWFASVTFCLALWSFCTAIVLSLEPDEVAVARRCGQLSFAVIALIGPLSLRFAAQLGRAEVRGRDLSLAFGLLTAVAVLLVPSWTVIGTRPAGGLWPRPCPSALLSVSCALPAIGSALLYGLRRHRELPASRRRRQLGWATAALVVAALSAVDIATLWTRGYPLAWAAGAASCATLFYAIAQHRLMAIRTFALKSALAVLGGGAALAMASAVERSGYRELGTPVFGLSALALFVVSRAWVGGLEPRLERLVAVRRRRVDRAIAEFEKRALDARGPEGVEAELERTLADGFGARLVRLWPREDETDGDDPAVDAALALIGRESQPILRDHLDPDGWGAPVLIEALDRLGADGLVPLDRQGERLGLLALAGGALIRADDELPGELVRLAELATRAWLNARLYEEVARRQEGLEAQVRLRTAELENALEELKTAQARLVDAERSSSLGLLVAGVSHEINNALNFISANLPTLERYADDCEALLARARPGGLGDAVAGAQKGVHQEIATLGEAIRGTGAIIADLRRFARPDAERRLFQVEEGLDAALHLLRRRTDGRLDVARLYVGAPSIEGYPGPLNQCFFHLLLNAVEAARSEVWLILRDRGERGGVEVLISDDGAGVQPEHLDQVFQPFYTTKGKAGLGLTVARAAVERHGGSLQLRSEEGGGVTVRVRLPPRAPEPSRPPPGAV